MDGRGRELRGEVSKGDATFTFLYVARAPTQRVVGIKTNKAGL